MTRVRRSPLLALTAVTFVACSAGAAFAAGASSAATEPPGSTTADSSAPESSAPELSTVVPDGPRQRWLDSVVAADPESFAGGTSTADLVDGNRVLVIGDSIMASTASRYGGEACTQLVPEGWAVEVDAETGRFIDFGSKVLDARLDDAFDVGVVMLGNNYGADPDVFEEYLRDVVDELAPRPTILYTVSLYRPDRAEVNDIVFDIASEHDNVRVIDWAAETEVFPELLGGDGLHLSTEGRERLIELLADELGPGPFGTGEDSGDCLRSSFTDDSATAPGGTTIPGQAPPPPPQNTRPNTVPQPTIATTTPPAPPPVVTEPPAPEPTGPTTPAPTDPPTQPPTVPPTQPPPPPTVPPTQAPPEPPAPPGSGG